MKLEGIRKLCEELDGRSPCGERGLKLSQRSVEESAKSVAPRAGSVD